MRTQTDILGFSEKKLTKLEIFVNFLKKKHFFTLFSHFFFFFQFFLISICSFEGVQHL